MATASWRTCREHAWMRSPNFRPNLSIDRRVIASRTFSNIAAVRHFELIFLPFWTTHEVKHAVRLPYQNFVSIRSSPPEILRFYNFASLAGKCLTTPPFSGFLGGLNPLKLWVVIQTLKRHNNQENCDRRLANI